VGPKAGLDGRKNLVPTGIRSRAVQPVVSRYTDRATRPTIILQYIITYQCVTIAYSIHYSDMLYRFVA